MSKYFKKINFESPYQNLFYEADCKYLRNIKTVKEKRFGKATDRILQNNQQLIKQSNIFI